MEKEKDKTKQGGKAKKKRIGRFKKRQNLIQAVQFA